MVPPLPHEDPVAYPDAPGALGRPLEVFDCDRLVRPLVAQVEADGRADGVIEGDVRRVDAIPVEVPRRFEVRPDVRPEKDLRLDVAGGRRPLASLLDLQGVLLLEGAQAVGQVVDLVRGGTQGLGLSL
jgi:hypothetical protein